VAIQGIGVSIQVAILKVLASHASGRATLHSLRRDIIILSTSGPDWANRIKRLAGRVQSIDIFGSGYVIRDAAGWEITAAGREFLRALEAVDRDNQPFDAEPSVSNDVEGTARPRSSLKGVGQAFKDRTGR
jgi:hypothetical protein